MKRQREVVSSGGDRSGGETDTQHREGLGVREARLVKYKKTLQRTRNVGLGTEYNLPKRANESNKTPCRTGDPGMARTLCPVEKYALLKTRSVLGGLGVVPLPHTQVS